MNGRYQTFSGVMSRPQRLANMLARQGGADNFTPPVDGAYARNPMNNAPAKRQFARPPQGMAKPLAPGMVSPAGGRYRGDFDDGQD